MMVFKEPNLMNDWKCPICNKSEIREVVLLPIYEKYECREDKDLVECEQVHLDCIEPWIYRDSRMIAMKY